MTPSEVNNLIDDYILVYTEPYDSLSHARLAGSLSSLLKNLLLGMVPEVTIAVMKEEIKKHKDNG